MKLVPHNLHFSKIHKKTFQPGERKVNQHKDCAHTTLPRSQHNSLSFISGTQLTINMAVVPHLWLRASLVHQYCPAQHSTAQHHTALLGSTALNPHETHRLDVSENVTHFPLQSMENHRLPKNVFEHNVVSVCITWPAAPPLSDGCCAGPRPAIPLYTWPSHLMSSCKYQTAPRTSPCG